MYDLIFVLTWCSLQDPVKPSEQLKYFFVNVFWNLLKIMTWKKIGS